MSNAAEAEIPQAPAEGETEARARRQGWRPLEEYNGNPDRWIDAESFLKRAETDLPVTRARLETMESRYAQTEAELGKTRQSLEEVRGVLNDFRTMAQRGEERAYKKAR